MKIPRIYNNLEKYITPGKVVVIYGPRRVGKTTLVNDFLLQTGLKHKYVIGDDISIQEILGSESVEKINRLVDGIDLLVIDEAQKIPKIGTGLKILVDANPNIKVVATGSASFDLQNKIGEPLVGRSRTLILYPISMQELGSIQSQYEMDAKLEEYLLFGTYPEVITMDTWNEKRLYLTELTNAYLLKDILELEKVKSPKVLLDLLRLLSYQVGSEVSLNELSRNLELEKKTIQRYLDLLEKSFIIFNLRALSRNNRKEIHKKSKYFFWDLGIRNSLISNFNEISHRDDIGKLWENFLMIERMKIRQYSQIYANSYFWRTWEQKEIDLVEEYNGVMHAYEFKWSEHAKIKKPKEFLKLYKNSEFGVITNKNYQDFVIKNLFTA